MDIVENTVFIHIIRDFKLVTVLIAEAECYTGINNRLTVQDILEKFLGNVYIRKDLKIGSPFDRRACLFTVGRAYGELLTFFADYLALLEVQLIFLPSRQTVTSMYSEAYCVAHEPRPLRPREYS